MRLPRFQLRLSLRMLLLLIAVAAIWMGWRVDKARRQRIAIAEIKHYKGFVGFDDKLVNGKVMPFAQGWAPNWLRRAVGDEYFREVTRVIYANQPPSDATLGPLSDLDAIYELNFSGPTIHGPARVDPPPGLDRLTEAGLSRLEGLTRLRRLSLESTELTGSMLRHLNHSPQLEELGIFEWGDVKSGITDEGLPPLEAMPQLRVLSLFRCKRINGSFLAQLRGSKSLEDLTLNGYPLSPAAMGHIATIANLRRLDLCVADVRDEDLSTLRDLTKLTKLSLSADRSTITDAGLVHLAGMTRLERLKLERCRITGSGLAFLGASKQLKNLYLGWTQVDDAGLEVIAGFPNLEILELHWTKITDAGLVHLKKLKNLEELSVNDTSVTPGAFEELAKSLPSMAKLRAAGVIKGMNGRH